MRVTASLLLAAVLAACGPSARSTVVFGAAGPWKAGYGAMNRRGIELAVEEINARGGIGGRPLELLFRDDDGDGAKAAQIAQSFVADPRISAVVGHVNSGAMVSAARVYDGFLPAVATTATSPDLTGISPWVFRVISSDSANGQALASFATALRKQRVAILYENDSYGRGLAESFRRNFTGTIVGVDPISSGGGDFEPFIALYKRLAPDLVFVASTDASGIAVLREARRQRFSAAFLGGDGWTAVVTDTAASEGAYVGAPFSASDPRPDAQRFVKAFEGKYALVPDGNAALAYDATMLLATAVTQAGTDRRALRDWLAAIPADHPVKGVTGMLRFQPDGDPVGKGIVMTRIQRGALLVADIR
ncbi:MAG: ABC transporter substrate-binding protein [Gemmatimonadaceae bacterium]